MLQLMVHDEQWRERFYEGVHDRLVAETMARPPRQRRRWQASMVPLLTAIRNTLLPTAPAHRQRLQTSAGVQTTGSFRHDLGTRFKTLPGPPWWQSGAADRPPDAGLAPRY
jgi:hypothetical protein